jgi:hypothetical protein
MVRVVAPIFSRLGIATKPPTTLVPSSAIVDPWCRARRPAGLERFHSRKSIAGSEGSTPGQRLNVRCSMATHDPWFAGVGSRTSIPVLTARVLVMAPPASCARRLIIPFGVEANAYAN